MLLGSYPITPASDILHELSHHKNFDVITFQAEDEIAAIGAALGASFAGCARHHDHERPRRGAQDRGDRAGHDGRASAGHRATSSAAVPRPGCPRRPSRRTCSRRSSAATAEAPVPVLAAAHPGDCFADALRGLRASRSKYMTPVFVLSDGYLANGSEPWRLPRPRRSVRRSRRKHPDRSGGVPAVRARSRDAGAAVGDPRHAGSRAPDRRPREAGCDRQRHLRPAEPREDGPPSRREGAADRAPDIPDSRSSGDPEGRSSGRRLGIHVRLHHRRGAPQRARGGARIGHVHLRYLNPLPPNLGEILKRYKTGPRAGNEHGTARVSCCARSYLVDAVGLNKIQGRPFPKAEIVGEDRRDAGEIEP